jgi:drug/metabolite transporter (DMT)-like permease
LVLYWDSRLGYTYPIDCKQNRKPVMTNHIAPGAAIPARRTLPGETRGMLLGLVGVAMFSLTFPFTRMAVAELDPAFVALGRALVAAALGAIWLRWHRVALPPRSALLPLALVSIGCVIGFPWLSSLALRTLPASHGAVLVGILPLATALFSALRGNETPSTGFWVMALLGSSLVVAFALRQSGGSFHSAHLLMFGAVALGAIGYAEGGRLSQTIGGQAVICWALVLSAPLLAPLVLWLSWPHLDAIAAAGARAWLGFAYVSVFSMFIGFFFWYRGMATGGIARVGQVQLVQPFLTLVGAAMLLGEPLALSNFVFALAVIAVVALGRKMGVRR